MQEETAVHTDDRPQWTNTAHADDADSNNDDNNDYDNDNNDDNTDNNEDDDDGNDHNRMTTTTRNDC